MRACVPFTCAVVLLGALAGPAVAQPESRAAEIAARKAEKAKAVEPHDPGLLERGLNLIEEEAGASPIGFYPYVGSVYSGGGLAFGAGYRYPVGDTGVIDVEAAYSIKGYWRVQERFRLPRFAEDRASIQLRHTLLDAPTAKFFGIGPASRADDRTQFGFRRNDVAAEFRFLANDRLTLGADAAYEMWDTRGGGSGAPSIETLFGPADAPGLGADPSFVKLRAFADLDWRDGPRYTRRGGRVVAGLTRYDARSGDPYDFSRVDVVATQHVPVYRENWVLAFRGIFSSTHTSGVNEVPFFLLPMAGESSDEFRGFPTYRFRDRNRLLLTGEYRWMPSNYLDLALFLDGGIVAREVGDLSIGDMKTAYGVSARFHTPVDTLFHMSVGRSREGWRFIFGVGQVF